MRKFSTLEKEFDERIRTRLRSEDWNLEIARSVMRRRLRNRVALGAAASSLLAASLVAVLLTGLPGTSREGENLDYFVNAQIEGTWNLVSGSGKTAQAGPSPVSDLQYDASLDAMIEETLARR